MWGGDTVAGDDGKRKEKGIPEKVPEGGEKRTGDPGRDTKTPGGQNVSKRVQRWDATRQQSDRSVGLYGRDDAAIEDLKKERLEKIKIYREIEMRIRCMKDEDEQESTEDEVH